jgi:hypothetical protein
MNLHHEPAAGVHGSRFYRVSVATTKTERKIESFRSLQHGWHFGEGGPLQDHRATMGKELLSTLTLLGLTKTDAFPGPNGELMLTAYIGDQCLEILIQPDDTITINHEVGSVSVSSVYGLTAAAARSRLSEIAPQIWNIPASFTHASTTFNETDFKALHSRTARAAEFQSFKMRASQVVEITSATT